MVHSAYGREISEKQSADNDADKQGAVNLLGQQSQQDRNNGRYKRPESADHSNTSFAIIYFILTKKRLFVNNMSRIGKIIIRYAQDLT